MARKPRVAVTIYVVDTSYLTELFGVPGSSGWQSSKEVRRRFKGALARNDLIFVPAPSLFEAANHISQVVEESMRVNLAGKLHESVAMSLESAKPWVVTPRDCKEDFLIRFREALNEFVQKYAKRKGFSLTDTFIVQEAKRLKETYAGLGYRVHIWTKDRDLKSQEPDKEPKPFTG